MSNGFTKKLLSIAVCLVVFVGVQYGIEYYREQNVIANVDHAFEKLKSDAAIKHPNSDLSTAIKQEAISQSEIKLKSETSKQRKLENAAGMFMGFFFVNTKTRPQFCNNQGVNIQPFVTFFEKKHVNELIQAKSILSGAGITQEKLYSMLEPQLGKVIAQDMNDVALQDKISMKDACTLLANNAEAIVEEMQISKTQSQVYQLLNDGIN